MTPAALSLRVSNLHAIIVLVCCWNALDGSLLVQRGPLAYELQAATGVLSF